MELEKFMQTCGLPLDLAQSRKDSSFDLDGVAPIVRASIEECELIHIGDTAILFVKPRRDMSLSTLKRLLEDTQSASGVNAVAYFDVLSKYMRKALLREHVPFAVGDGQFYIPKLLSLYPMESKRRKRTPSELPPVAKLVFIWWLLRFGSRELSHMEIDVAEIVSDLGISRISALRACDSLAYAGCLTKKMGGEKNRTALFSAVNPTEFAELGSKLFGTPIKEEFYIEREDAEGLLFCGESALSMRSLLVEPRIPLFAASPNQGKTLLDKRGNREELQNPAKVKTLKYDPRLLADGDMVDLFTMLKTLESDDERIRLSLSEAMEDCAWYESRE